MDIARTIQVLLLDSEGTPDLAVRFHSMPERAGMGLVVVADPRTPTNEFPLSRDM